MTTVSHEQPEMLGTLLGNYRVLARLGEGGMGEVYVGRHEQLGHSVAVKVLQHELSRQADMVRRFFNEAQAATSIRHSGIVQIFDVGTAPDGRAYFTMELLEGQTLAARLKQRRLAYVECCRIGRQVANVLQAAHAAGIAHRDLKPDNLFLVPDTEVAGGERVKVLDFGIAKVLDAGIDDLAGEPHTTNVKTRTGLMMGTPLYMSPEQCRGAGVVDTRSDIYSLGCILFQMICGRPPFIGEGPGEILGAHQYLEPPPPQSLAPDLPGELARLILEMLAKRPDARPQTMTAVGQALEEILRRLEGGPARAPTPVPIPPSGGAAAPMPPGERAWATSPETRTGSSRLPAVLGGLTLGTLVIVVAVAAMSSGAPGPAKSASASASASASMDAELEAKPASNREPPATDPPGAAKVQEPPANAPSATTAPRNNLEVECLRYEAEQKWNDLAACAKRLQATNPALANELKQRVELETGAIPRATAFDTAIVPGKCNAEEIANKARDLFAVSQLAAALAGYEAAWACKQDQAYVEKAFIVSCNIPNLGKAKLHWKRMSAAMRQRALMICVRNGITEDMLGAP